MELMLKCFELLDKYFDDLGRNSFFAVWLESLMVNTMAMVMVGAGAGAGAGNGNVV